MTTVGTVIRYFEVWYQSRVSVIAASGFMTAVTSRILTGSLDWRAILIVGLCTAAAYWMDDCLDFSRDRRRSPVGLHSGVRTLKLVGVVCAIAGTAALIRRCPVRIVELLLALGALTLGFCLVSARIRDEVRGSRGWITFRSVYIALVWSLATVLLPVFDRGTAIDFQVVASIGFVWTLMLVVSEMWAEGEHPERQAGKRVWRMRDRVLIAACCVAGLLIIVGVIFRAFPVMNLALLPAVGWNSLFIWFRHRFQRTDRRVLNEVLILMNLVACVFAVGAYTYPVEGFGPWGWQDWFQLAALVVFFGNIAIKATAQKSQDDSGDYLDLVLVVGLAVFGFQVLVSALHVEGWLFGFVHWQMFDSRWAWDAGCALTCIALVLQSVAYVSMSDSWRLMGTSEGPSKLVTTGLFALTRNPIYVAADLFMAGEFLMTGTVVFSVAVLLGPILVHLQILREEAFLLERCGGEYELYMRRTPRYFF